MIRDNEKLAVREMALFPEMGCLADFWPAQNVDMNYAYRTNSP
jgi:hypothetical protein